jgi:ethanolamine ammonia-lyase small subunit
MRFSPVETNEPKMGEGARLVRAGAGGDRWVALKAHTPARIALGRAGGSLRTESLLDFRMAHARARDAVHQPFDTDGLAASLRGLGLEAERLATAAPDRATYLARPDLGRRLETQSAERLRAAAGLLGRRDLAVLVSDGLSAAAAHAHAAETVAELDRILRAAGWTLYPVFVVPLARVKLQDAVGEILGARHSLMLLGERPGLSAHDSLGAYLTFEPRADRTDADRNCVSNIRGDGLPPMRAAAKIANILIASRRRGLSGTALREG